MALSPCIGACALDVPASRCLGCGRSLAEIEAWPHLDDMERARIMARLAGQRGQGKVGGDVPSPPNPPPSI